jgi:glutaredoxin
MIRSILLIVCVWVGVVFAEASQDEPQQPENFRSYSEMAEAYDAKTKSWKPGTYFVLVSAEWCVPCKSLKAQLSHYPTPIYLVDLGEEPALAKQIMQMHKTVPCLVKYELHTDPKKNRRTVFRYGGDLDLFLSVSVLEMPAKQP